MCTSSNVEEEMKPYAIQQDATPRFSLSWNKTTSLHALQIHQRSCSTTICDKLTVGWGKTLYTSSTNLWKDEGIWLVEWLPLWELPWRREDQRHRPIWRSAFPLRLPLKHASWLWNNETPAHVLASLPEQLLSCNTFMNRHGRHTLGFPVTGNRYLYLAAQKARHRDRQMLPKLETIVK